jgi:3-isopropylmalate/(R)-2-methylmalate dehydratase small subunit
VDLMSGLIRDRTNGRTYQARPLPAFVLKIAEAGGIIPFLRKHDLEKLL